MDRFIRAARFISQLCGYAAAGLIAAGVFVVCEMVFLRYVLNQNTIWQTDFVTYSLVAATFIGSPYVLLIRGHVNVDILPHYLGRIPRFWFALASGVLTFAFALTMTTLTGAFWHEAWENDWVSDTMWRARLWIPYACMPIGLAFLCLQSLADLLAVATRREPPFGIGAPRRGSE